MPLFTGSNRKDTINGSNDADIIFALAGNDTVRGRGGNDQIHGGDGDDDLDGGTGNDVIYGDDGNDEIAGGDNNDTLIGGAGYDRIDGGSGTDTAVYSGSIFEYQFGFFGNYRAVIHNGGAGADGIDLVRNVERLQFNDVTIYLTQNNAPIARDDSATTDEDVGLYSSGDSSVLDNDYDFEGNKSVVPAVIAGTYGTLTINSDGTYFYQLYASAQALAQGATVQDNFSYTVTDGSLSDTGTLTINVNGINDAPVANDDTASIGENGAPILVNVLANDTDVDNGAVLTLTAASAPAGQGSASVVSGKVRFDPRTDFDDLAAGQTEQVVVSYTVQDEHGASDTGSLTITVTGANDAPTANPDTATTHEDVAVTIDALANDTDVDNNHVLTLVSVSVTPGEGSVSIVNNKVRYNPSPDLDYLADGESLNVVVTYTMQDEHGVQSSSTVTVTVQGETDGSITGTDNGETIVGTPNDDGINARGGDDIVFGQDGNDVIRGGDGNDSLNGEGGNDLIRGGEGDDIGSGGDGFDTLEGEAGNDTLSGGNDGDVLFGGEGDDSLSGQAGDDFIHGDEGDDQISGGDGNDDLNGDAGNDIVTGGLGDDLLKGGDGNDSMAGGDGNDELTDLAGTNSFTGGAGNDNIQAGSADGAQTIDGGDGNDTIRHYFRYNASTITTGAGSDSIEISNADQGTEAITVTDFTPGSGGDIFRLEGDDGSLLGLLIGWDGSSNPFGSGFLRLRQSGSDTLLEWDRDGSGTGTGWETLAVFENSDVDDYTDANFFPGYHPDGSAPAGQTINGTAASETLTGTIGDDTINAMGGNDTVNGGAGADTINGGDGADQLNGQTDDDTIDGGNDDDIIFGGDGNDTAFGQAGADTIFGGLGNDQLSGGTGDDALNGGEGDDSLDGGDGNDILTDESGTNSLTGGLGNDQITARSTNGVQTIDGGDGNDTIKHYYRLAASIITTGAGSDTIEIAYADQGEEAVTVTDFTAGAGGDIFRLTGDEGALLGLLVGWDGTSNPFSTGFLRLTQDGADTLLEWDQDGDSAGSGWETIAVFQNTDVGDFTEDNFDPPYPPGGGAPPGETITGTAGDDTLIGTIGADTINALGGSDSAFGLDGADTINGGSGIDTLYGGAGDDVMDGGTEDDVLSGEDGNDQLLGQAGNDQLFGDSGDDILSGGAGMDSLTGDSGNDILSGGDDDDFLSGGTDSDTLSGGGGNDVLAGGDGTDSLSGGLGSDIFDYQTALEGPDSISDFASGVDHIRVSADGFGGGLVAGGGVSLISGSNPTANSASGQFLFDTDDGRLFWDADGTGAGAAVLIATLTNVPSLQSSDIIVV